jgi:hypothetical protein
MTRDTGVEATSLFWRYSRFSHSAFDDVPPNSLALTDVRYGSWLCKNAKTLNRDRRSCSSKTALVVQLASEFNLEVELKNIILVAFRFFQFLHSQGHSHRFGRVPTTSALPLIVLQKSFCGMRLKFLEP